MVQRQINVIERVANLVSNGGREPADDCAFLSLVKLCFELTRATEFRRHLVEGGGERSHFIDSIGRHLHIEVAAGHLSRRGREHFNWTSKAPHEKAGDQS